MLDGKVNQYLMQSGGQNLKFSIVSKSAGKNITKMKENSHFQAKSFFDKLDFGFWCTSKTNNCRYIMTFSLNVHIITFYT